MVLTILIISLLVIRISILISNISIIIHGSAPLNKQEILGMPTMYKKTHCSNKLVIINNKLIILGNKLSILSNKLLSTGSVLQTPTTTKIISRGPSA